MMTAVGAEALHRADNVAMCADIAAALSVEVLKGTRRAFHSSIHSVRPHVGQGQVAKRLRTLLTPSSELFMSHMYKGKVQDAYSLRCVPQVHGVVHDTIKFVGDTLTTEMNSVRWLGVRLGCCGRTGSLTSSCAQQPYAPRNASFAMLVTVGR